MNYPPLQRVIKLSPKFIERSPNLIRITAQKIQSNDTDTSSANVYFFAGIIFGEAKLNETIDEYPFSKLLAFTSAQILEQITIDSQKRQGQSPQLDCLKLLYGFVFASKDIFRPYPIYVPFLSDIPYLKENTEVPFRIEQLNFIQEMMAKCGFIAFSKDFIDIEWCYGNITEYIIGYDEIF